MLPFEQKAGIHIFFASHTTNYKLAISCKCIEPTIQWHGKEIGVIGGLPEHVRLMALLPSDSVFQPDWSGIQPNCP